MAWCRVHGEERKCENCNDCIFENREGNCKLDDIGEDSVYMKSLR